MKIEAGFFSSLSPKPALLALAAVLAFSAPGHSRKPPQVALSADTLFFSPNRDGEQDEIRFKLELERVKDVSTWELKFRDVTGVARKTFSGTGKVPASAAWDGQDDFGAPCSEGHYTVSFKVWDEKTQQLAAPDLRVVLDNTPPVISLGASRKTLSLAENAEPVGLNFSAVDLAGIAEWKVHLQNKDREDFFSESSTSALPTAWILSAQKTKPAPGKIIAILSVVDKAGNRGSSPPVELQVVEGAATEQESSLEEEKPDAPSARNNSGPFLQLTAIVSIADLFGKDAGRGSNLLPQAAALLDPLARSVLDHPGTRAIVLGHVDPKETAQESKALSSYFAWRVFSFFVKDRGCAKGSISVKGLGADVPIAENRTLMGRARNRRIEIQVFLPSGAE